MNSHETDAPAFTPRQLEILEELGWTPRQGGRRSAENFIDSHLSDILHDLSYANLDTPPTWQERRELCDNLKMLAEWILADGGYPKIDAVDDYMTIRRNCGHCHRPLVIKTSKLGDVEWGTLWGTK